MRKRSASVFEGNPPLPPETANKYCCFLPIWSVALVPQTRFTVYHWEPEDRQDYLQCYAVCDCDGLCVQSESKTERELEGSKSLFGLSGNKTGIVCRRDEQRAQYLYLYLYLLRQQNYVYLYLFPNRGGNKFNNPSLFLLHF